MRKYSSCMHNTQQQGKCTQYEHSLKQGKLKPLLAIVCSSVAICMYLKSYKQYSICEHLLYFCNPVVQMQPLEV